jgi:transposase
VSSLSIACYFPWSRIKVASQSVDEKAELSQINIVPDLRYKPLCHKCDCDKGKIHKWHHRAVRDLNFAKAKVFLNVRYRSLSCPRCGGTGVEKLEFVEPRKRITKRLANYIRDLCRKLPVSQVAEHLDLDWKTVKNIDKTFLEKEYGETDYAGLCKFLLRFTR